MRLRNVPGSQEHISADPYTIQTDGTDGSDHRGKWASRYLRDTQPLHMEIGMGKGKFLLEMAKQNPDINYIGIEKFSSVLVRAIELRGEWEPDNLIFLRMDAEYVDQYFAPDEIDGIYLNFSDPWPKERHTKRRLTSLRFLDRYSHFLKPGGFLQFKTDNRPLFDFSLEQIRESGWHLEECSFDLYKDTPAPDNIMTEYEERFYRNGIPICRMVCRRNQTSA